MCSSARAIRRRGAVAIAAAVAIAIIGVAHYRGQPAHRARADVATPRSDAGPTTLESSARTRHLADPPGTLRLEGQVLDDDEQPVGNAHVVLESAPPRHALTELDGSFAFPQLIGREYSLRAWTADAVAGPVRVAVTAQTEPVILRLRPGARAEITVLEGDRLQPIAGASVSLGEPTDIAAISDDAGIARLAPLGPGIHRLQIDAPGFMRDVTSLSVGSPPGPYRLTVTMRRGPRVGGHVVDGDGRAVAGASISWRDASDLFGTFAGDRVTVTDGEGAWTIAALAPGRYRFEATHPDHGDGTSEEIIVDDDGVADVTIQMSAEGVITGTVIDDTAKPVGDAVVQVAASTPSRAWSLDVRTRADGTFRIGGLPGARVALEAYDPSRVSDVVAIDVVPGQTKTITLRLDQAGSIQGTVVSTTGEAVPEATVFAIREIDATAVDDPTTMVRGAVRDITDAGGGFRLTGLAAGTYRLGASTTSSPDAVAMMRTAQVRARPGDRNVKVTITTTGSIAGRVALDDGRPATSFSVALDSGLATAGVDGRFTIENVATGDHYLTVAGPDLVRQVFGPFRSGGGDRTDVGTLVVTGGRRVSGVVRHRGGAPAAGATVVVGGALLGGGDRLGGAADEAVGARRATTDADGRFSLGGLGRGALYAMAELDAQRSPALALPAASDDVTIDLVLDATVSLQGTVRDDAGPAADAIVSAMPVDAPGTALSVTTGARGEYRIDRLPSGKYLVQAITRRGLDAILQADVVVVAGSTRHDITIPRGAASVVVTFTEDGRPVDYAQIILSTAVDDAPAGITAGTTYTTTVIAGVTSMEARFTGVPPGPVRACAIALPANPLDPGSQAAIEAAGADLAPICETSRATAGTTTMHLTTRR